MVPKSAKCENCGGIIKLFIFNGPWTHLQWHSNCANAKPVEPKPEPVCTCDWPHYNCNGYRFFTSGRCDCSRHVGQIHWS